MPRSRSLRDWEPTCTAEVVVGASRQDASGKTVGVFPRREFLRALREAAAVRFPSGTTTIRATGSWLTPGRRVVREPSALVQATGYGPDCDTVGRRAENLGRHLSRRFKQTAVLVRVRGANGQTCQAFVAGRGPRERVRGDCRVPVRRAA